MEKRTFSKIEIDFCELNASSRSMSRMHKDFAAIKTIHPSSDPMAIRKVFTRAVL